MLLTGNVIWMIFFLSFDSLGDLALVARQSLKLFKSRGFKLRKWVANAMSKFVLLNEAQEDLGANLRKIDLSSELMSNAKALGLVWDVDLENDTLRMRSKRSWISVYSTRREMLSVLASQFNPLGFLAPCLLKGKLILQKVTSWIMIGTIFYRMMYYITGMIGSCGECAVPRCCFF